MNDVATNILEVSDLCVDYASTTSFGVTGAPSVRAVKGISLRRFDGLFRELVK